MTAGSPSATPRSAATLCATSTICASSPSSKSRSTKAGPRTWQALLLAMKAAVAQARARGDACVDAAERRPFIRRSEDLLATGLAANPPPERQPGQKGRLKPSPARTLLERLWKEHEAVLAFLDDFTIPFDNNQAEQDLRMPEGPPDNRRVVPGGHGLGSFRADQRLPLFNAQAGGGALSCLAIRL